MSSCTMKEVYDKFGLEAGTRDFIGHAMGLYLNDEYVDKKGQAPEAIDRIRMVWQLCRTIRQVALHLPTLWPR